MNRKITLFTICSIHLLFLTGESSQSDWKNLPQIPTGRRSQFYLLQTDGGYKYGYDTGIDSAAKQSGTSANEVEGHYFYTAPTGQKLDLKYKSGVQGFVPENLDTLLQSIGQSSSSASSASVSGASAGSYSSSSSSQSNDVNNDGSYSFEYNAGDSSRKESADASGNVKGRYSYTNSAGSHDLSYLAGADTGFVATGGSLSIPNGLGSAGVAPIAPLSASSIASQSSDSNDDASYSFEYNTGDSSRQESADASGTVKGRYSYTNLAGNHDLSYIAGADTGFIATGGSLSIPNGLGSTGSAAPIAPLSASSGAPQSSDSSDDGSYSQSSDSNDDGSYSFEYNTGDSSRKESADASGTVKGRYSYTNSAGNHDLSYTAGADTGFVATGGSLSIPNGLGSTGSAAPIAPLSASSSASQSSDSNDDGSYSQSSDSNDDGSYSFEYNTKDSSRKESADASGNVKGRYSYTNSAGNHDLSYIAGADTGFVATAGSLSIPNGLGSTGSAAPIAPLSASSSASQFSDSNDDGSYSQSSDSNDDGSYSFEYNTGDSSRQESADTSGNVKGRYSYTNSAGNHDLSYIAGADTGFVATGGSLSIPNGLVSSGSLAPIAPLSASSSSSQSSDSNDDGSYSQSSDSNDDGSYSFEYNTGDSSRQESADASGNVKGRYSYTNSAGSHDLSYIAGADSGFVATGGSLSIPNGLGSTGSVAPIAPLSASSSASQSSDSNDDGSYSFKYNTGDSSRQESADASGNVKGRYSYTNSAGSHDLSYIAGADTGFVATGGSLSIPNGLGQAAPVAPIVPLSGSQSGYSYPIPSNSLSGDENGEDDQANTGDASYSFTIDTDEYQRKESSDASGNVQGSYSYKNSAGNHDLSYVAGSESGFVATGGSLKTPPGLTEAQLNSGVRGSSSGASSDDNSGDGSYNFNIDTDTYKRQESSDASGNVKGSYSYRNSAGSHSLSFVAGSSTGFKPTGGSLAIPPGLSTSQLKLTPVNVLSPPVPVARIPVSPSVASVSSYSIGSAKIQTYLPPGGEIHKYGYIYDTQ